MTRRTPDARISPSDFLGALHHEPSLAVASLATSHSHEAVAIERSGVEAANMRRLFNALCLGGYRPNHQLVS